MFLAKKLYYRSIYQKLHVLYLLLFYQVTMGQHIRTFKIVNGKNKKSFWWEGCLDIKVSDALIHVLTFYLILLDNWVCCEMQMWGLNRQHLSLRFISSPVMHFQSTFYTDDEFSYISDVMQAWWGLICWTQELHNSSTLSFGNCLTLNNI